MTTPIRAALVSKSPLRPGVRDGLGALAPKHKPHIDAAIRPTFSDSLDIDEGLRKGRDGEHRWDYLLGHDEHGVVALEPHSAYTGEVSTVIAKKRAAREQLRAHLAPGASVAEWFWVASGRVDFAPHDKVLRRLEQDGIRFVGERLRAHHLPAAPAAPARKPKKARARSKPRRG